MSFYEIVEDSPCIGGVKLIDVVTPKSGNIWGVSQQNSYKVTKLRVTKNKKTPVSVT